MERTKEFIPWHFQRAIIAFEIAVVHLMVKCTEFETIFIFDHKPCKPCMRGRGRQSVILHMKQNVHGVGCNDPVDQDRA